MSHRYWRHNQPAFLFVVDLRITNLLACDDLNFFFMRTLTHI